MNEIIVTVTTPEYYVESMQQYMAGHPYKDFVTFHSVEAIKENEMIPILSRGCTVGMLIWDHKDGRVEATGLYKSHASVVKQLGLDLLWYGVHYCGVNYLECFGPKLPTIYKKLGFITKEVYPFDPELSPNWNYEKFGRPDYHIMELQ